jgi:uncharacterized membrane protein
MHQCLCNDTKAFVFLLFLLVAIDLVIWLSWSVTKLYKPAYLRAGLPWRPHLLPGIGAWFCIALGIYIFVIPCIHQKKIKTWWQIFLVGALFGFVVYGTYNFTTLSIFPTLPFHIILLDVLWGSILCGAVSTIFHLSWRS